MERIYDTREYHYENCADPYCHNQTGPWFNETPPFPLYCDDCREQRLIEEVTDES